MCPCDQNKQLSTKDDRCEANAKRVEPRTIEEKDPVDTGVNK